MALSSNSLGLGYPGFSLGDSSKPDAAMQPGAPSRRRSKPSAKNGSSTKPFVLKTPRKGPESMKACRGPKGPAK